MTSTRFSFVRVSANRKTGPIPVTMTTRDTCPDSCAFKGAGCYAEFGPVGWHWAKLGRGQNAHTLTQLARLIRTLPGGQLWRHNIAGDLPGHGETINGAALDKLTHANRGRRGFTYTHKPVSDENLAAMRRATGRGFTINLSADNGEQADILAATGLPVVVVVPHNAAKVSHTPLGRKIVTCPAENSAKITCNNCGLCALATRDYLIGFKPKGARRQLVNITATNEAIS